MLLWTPVSSASNSSFWDQRSWCLVTAICVSTKLLNILKKQDTGHHPGQQGHLRARWAPAPSPPTPPSQPPTTEHPWRPAGGRSWWLTRCPEPGETPPWFSWHGFIWSCLCAPRKWEIAVTGVNIEKIFRDSEAQFTQLACRASFKSLHTLKNLSDHSFFLSFECVQRDG